jgi:translation initiation factor IF-2
MKEKEIGYVSNFFSQISVAAVEITNGKVSVGDTLHFKGHTTDFTSKIASIQISVNEAKKGDSIGIKVSGKARKLDKAYKLIEE